MGEQWEDIPVNELVHKNWSDRCTLLVMLRKGVCSLGVWQRKRSQRHEQRTFIYYSCQTKKVWAALEVTSPHPYGNTATSVVGT